MSRSVREYLQHILDETRYLLNQAHGLDKEAFLAGMKIVSHPFCKIEQPSMH